MSDPSTGELNDRASDPEESSTPLWKTLATFSIPLLCLVGGLELAAVLFGDKASRLDREGVLATAERIDVSVDAVGVLLSPNSSADYKLKNLTVKYRFVTQEGAEVVGSFSGRNYEPPPIGSTFEVRYLPSDPQVHETELGHTESQTSALHWIAMFFVALWFVIVVFSVFSALRPKRMTTREKRLQRMKELQAKT